MLRPSLQVFKADFFRALAHPIRIRILETLDGLAAHGEAGNAGVEASVRARVAELTRRFPIYV